MDAFGYGLMLGAMSNVEEAIRDVGRRPVERYDWDDPAFKAANAKVRDEFYARHPEIVRGPGQFEKNFPKKYAAILILDRLSERDAITPDEFETLYAEILNF